MACQPLPEEGDSIEPNETCSGRNVEKHRLNDLQQYFRIAVIQIYLVCAERRPHLGWPARGLELG
jgi:hypothetical protein